MKTIQVGLDAALLRAANAAAKRARSNRSELIRNALRKHLRDLRTRELEKRDRGGYTRHPAEPHEVWEGEVSWPS